MICWTSNSRWATLKVGIPMIRVSLGKHFSLGDLLGI